MHNLFLNPSFQLKGSMKYDDCFRFIKYIGDRQVQYENYPVLNPYGNNLFPHVVGWS